MQHVKDDMDDVFRKAAENYPLDTKSADWSKVLAALQGEVPAAIIPEKKTDKKGRLLWLLLLLPSGLICNRLYTPGHLEGGSEQTAAKPKKLDSRFDNTKAKRKVGT